MKRWAVIVVLVACGGKDPPPAPPPSNFVAVPDAGPPDAPMSDNQIVIQAFTAFRDDMCKCVDKACADAVQERMTKWSVKMANEAEQNRDKPSEEGMKRLTEIGTQYGECMVKAMTPVPGATP